METDRFHWAESNIEAISVSDREIEVVASSVFMLGEIGPKRVRVVFSNVSRSERKVTEYLDGSPRSIGFKEPYIVQDVPPVPGSPSAKEYGLEGVTVFEPIAWLAWSIHAESCEVHAI